MDHMDKHEEKLQTVLVDLAKRGVFITWNSSVTGGREKHIMTFILTGGGDIIDSLPGLSDVYVTVGPTFGKVLCYYFIEVPAWHHTRELPYRC